MAAGAQSANEWETLDRYAQRTPMRLPDPTANPFKAKPEGRRRFRPMTAEEHVALSEAPRKPGTRVTVRSYDVFRRGRRDNIAWWPDHMFVEYDDGGEQYIYRGGPSRHGLHVEVTPAERSRDNGMGTRVLDQRFIAGSPARDAIRPAQAQAAVTERARPPYLGVISNSNTAVGDVTEGAFGYRVGDWQTPGARQRPQHLYPMTQPIW